jgi:hypothetical protein
MTSIQAAQDRAAFERHLLQPNSTTRADLKKIFHEPDDSNLEVQRNSIRSLLSWATARQKSAWSEFKGQDREFQAIYWDGYKQAISEILNMEHQ